MVNHLWCWILSVLTQKNQSLSQVFYPTKERIVRPKGMNQIEPLTGELSSNNLTVPTSKSQSDPKLKTMTKSRRHTKICLMNWRHLRQRGDSGKWIESLNVPSTLIHSLSFVNCSGTEHNPQIMYNPRNGRVNLSCQKSASWPNTQRNRSNPVQPGPTLSDMWPGPRDHSTDPEVGSDLKFPSSHFLPSLVSIDPGLTCDLQCPIKTRTTQMRMTIDLQGRPVSGRPLRPVLSFSSLYSHLFLNDNSHEFLQDHFSRITRNNFFIIPKSVKKKEYEWPGTNGVRETEVSLFIQIRYPTLLLHVNDLPTHLPTYPTYLYHPLPSYLSTYPT